MIVSAVKNQASQEFVPIKEIRDGVIVLKDESLRMVIMVSSVNFALKSGEEQEAIIMQYQNFLNSLDFSAELFIQSRSLNIEPYLETLKERERKETDELLKIQIQEYIDFVREFVTSTDIVTKTFYVVVPYKPSILETGKGGAVMGFLDGFLKKQKTKEKVTPQQKFEEYKLQLQQRADTVVQGLARSGLRTIPLNTEELIELFYNLYNPGEGEKTNLPPINNN